MSLNKDSLYANPVGEIGAFQFDQKVVDVFPDMIRRSVPGYSTIISAIGLLAGRYCQDHSHCYDLGCSLGAATLAMREQIKARDCRIVAVDNSPAMLKQLTAILAQEGATVEVDLRLADIRDIEISRASVVVLNFTLQFIPVAARKDLLRQVYQGLLPGGVLLLSEKLQFDDPRQQKLHTDMHHAFKKAQGYSELEISQKRSALETVLIAETFHRHRQRLFEAGFSSVEIWFQYFNFASLVAMK